METVLTPKRIVEELDKYIISQEEAKKSVAISLRNRYRRSSIEDEVMRREITPKNIILVGSTGVGKTEIARRLAKIARAPFLKVEATKYTEVGYVGKDVETMIKDLVTITFRMVKEEKISNLREEFYEKSIELVAKLYKPYDVLNDVTKTEIIENIKSGKLNDEAVEIEKTISKPSMMPLGNIDGEGSEGVIGGVMSLFEEPKIKKIKMSIKNAIEYVLNEEIEKTLDYDEFLPEVIKKAEEDGIIFIDEIDKIAEREDGNGSSRGEASRQGVQRDILPIVEGTTVMTKYGPVRTEHILFIAAGAFMHSSPADLMPELQGRFPVKVKLKNLVKEDFIKILTSVEYNLLEQYKALLKKDGVELDFSKSAVERIAEVAMEQNEFIENIGARRLASILETLLREIMFEAPYEEVKKVKIDKKLIDKYFKQIEVEENLEKYIL